MDMRKEDKIEDKNSRPYGLFWVFIVLLLIAFSFSVVFFTDYKDYDFSILGNLKGDSSGESDSRTYSVDYKNGTFSPTNLRIRSGDTVRFENSSIFPIFIISGDLPGLNSMGDIPTGGVFSYTFANDGIFSYYNKNDSQETGQVIVR